MTDAAGPHTDHRQRIERLVRLLSETDAELQELSAGEIDAVVDPVTASPILLRNAQEAIARSEARYRDLVERCPALVLELDREGVVLFANPAVQTVLGFRPEEIAGRNLWVTLVPEEERDSALMLAEPMRERDLTGVELPLRARDGATRRMVVNSVARRAADRAGESVIVFAIDQTARRQAEENSRQLMDEKVARAEAEAASKAKSEFLAMMSHELRTPLNAISGYSQLLEMGVSGGALTDAQRDQLARIRASGQHLVGLVNEVLDLAKVEAGRLTVRASPYDTTQTIRAASTLVEPQAVTKSIRLGIAGGEEAGSYVGDEVRVRQILVNLLANALKFTDSGGRVTLTALRTEEPDPETHLYGPGPWVAIHVEDTGIGIAPEQLPLIFDPFVQAEAGYTRSKGGTGLGLTISRRLARLMGGDITVRSTPGNGSTFTLWLPTPEGIAQAEREAEGDEAQAPRVYGLAEIGDCVLREAEGILDAFVSRLRTEPLMPSAKKLRFSQLADHLATLIADLAESLVALEEARGQQSPLLADSLDIQRLLAERHGIQRARLGWTEEAVAREYHILREETDRAINRCFASAGEGRKEEAHRRLAQWLSDASEVSISALRSVSR